MPERHFAEIDVKAGAASETQSGIERMRPRIYGVYETPDGAGVSKTAAILMHPTNNFMNHPLMRPLAQRGVTCMGVNSRYLNNDATLIMERVIQDLGAAIRFMRERGHETVVLIGFSGGAALSAFYQAQATRLTITDTPAGDPIAIAPEDLPPADGIGFCAAHAGRSRLFLEWLDPSLIDEADPQSVDPSLDMYDPRNGPPYSTAFLERYWAGQRARRDRIEAWAWARLRQARERKRGGDEAFVVHRTFADPRFMDISIDRNDRAPGGIWGNAPEVNYASNAIGRYTSLTAFLSQWASCSRADGPTNARLIDCPRLYMDFTADASSFPSTRDDWLEALGPSTVFHAIKGADHYIKGRPELLGQAADAFADWIKSL